MGDFKARGTDGAKLVQVILTESLRGDGKDESIRSVTQFWSPEGQLLAESDPCGGKGANAALDAAAEVAYREALRYYFHDAKEARLPPMLVKNAILALKGPS